MQKIFTVRQNTASNENWQTTQASDILDRVHFLDPAEINELKSAIKQFFTEIPEIQSIHVIYRLRILRAHEKINRAIIRQILDAILMANKYESAG